MRRFSRLLDSFLLLLFGANERMVSFFAGGIAVFTLDLLHVLTPQIAVVFADVMRQYLNLRHLIILAPIAVKSSILNNNISGLLLLHRLRLLLLWHHRYRLLLHLLHLFLLQLLLLLLLLLLFQISPLPVTRCARSAILHGGANLLIIVLLLGID